METTSKNSSSFSSSPQDQQRILPVVRIPQLPPPENENEGIERLQTYCIQWRGRLQQCVANYHDKNTSYNPDDCHINHTIATMATPLTTPATTITTTATTNTTELWQQQYKVDSDYHMEIYQLEQELQQLFLNHGKSGNSNNKNDDTTIAMRTFPDEFKKCQDLLNVLHINATNNSNKINTTTNNSIKATRNAVPFLFYKYRLRHYQRNPAQRSPIDVGNPMINNIVSDTLNTNTVTETKRIDPILVSSSSSSATIEHVTNTTIVVDKEGNVQYQPKKESDVLQSLTTHSTNPINGDADGTVTSNDIDSRISSSSTRRLNGVPQQQTVSGETIVIRNVQNCHIQLLGNYYKSIYFVNVDSTTIHIYYPVMGAIHVTECHYVSFIHILQAQQLRLHSSDNIHCYNTMIHAGTILEDCHQVTFYVPPTGTMSLSNVRNSIKDFNWLRNGIPSPNFSIQTMIDPNTTIQCSSQSRSIMNPSGADDVTVGLLDQSSATASNNENSDDDEI